MDPDRRRSEIRTQHECWVLLGMLAYSHLYDESQGAVILSQDDLAWALREAGGDLAAPMRGD